jgi:hypothetical protein
MGCNCKKSSTNVIGAKSQMHTNVMPKSRGVNNGRAVSKIKRVIRRQFK